MSDQWLYRIDGQVFGPASLDLVRSLVLSGAIAPDDEVRNATRSNWILACAATELCDSMKATSDLEVERRNGRDEWFCRGAAGDYGPLKLVDLIQLAADGELGPDEEIKAHADDYWKQVGSIRRLVELMPFAERKRSAAAQSVPPRLAGDRFCQGADERIQVEGVTRETDLESDHSILVFPRPHGKSPSLLDDAASSLQPTVLESDTSRDLDRESNSQADPSGCSDLDEPDVIHFPGSQFAGAMSESARFGLADTSIDSIISALGQYGALSPFDRSATVAPDGQSGNGPQIGGDRWSGWAKGEEFTSLTFSELLSWAVTGRLLPTDFVRRGNEEQYVPAVNIPALFTVRAAANSLFRRHVSPNVAVPSNEGRHPDWATEASVGTRTPHAKMEAKVDSSTVCLQPDVCFRETHKTGTGSAGEQQGQVNRHAAAVSVPVLLGGPRPEVTQNEVRAVTGSVHSIGMRVAFVIALLFVGWVAGW